MSLVKSRETSGNRIEDPICSASLKSSQRKRELTNQLRQRTFLRSLAGKVGHRVETNIIVASPQAVERIQSADRVVPLENADPLVEVGQANPGSEPAHPSTDDDRIVLGIQHDAADLERDPKEQSDA